MSEVCLDPFQKLLEIVLIPSKNLIQWFLWNWNQHLKWQFLKLKVLIQYNLLTLCLIDANMLTDDGREIIEIFVSYCKAIMSLCERKTVSTGKTLWFTACCNLRSDQRREGSFLSAVGVVCPVQCWTDSLCSEPRLQWAYPIQHRWMLPETLLVHHVLESESLCVQGPLLLLPSSQLYVWLNDPVRLVTQRLRSTDII